MAEDIDGPIEWDSYARTFVMRELIARKDLSFSRKKRKRYSLFYEWALTLPKDDEYGWYWLRDRL